MGQPAEAIKDFDAALQHDPLDAEITWRRGRAHDELGADDKALADFNRAIALNPNLANAYLDRGALYFNKRNLAMASLADFRKAASLELANQTARDNIEAVLKARNADDAAIAALTASIEQAPGDGQRFAQRAYAHRLRAENDNWHWPISIEALIDLSGDPRCAVTAQRGLIDIDLRNLDRALVDNLVLVRLPPNEAYAHMNMGCLHHSQGRKEDAIASYRQAVKIDPNDSAVDCGLGAAGGASQHEAAGLGIVGICPVCR